jgi:hypothetical protein
MNDFFREGVIYCATHDKPLGECRHPVLGGGVPDAAKPVSQQQRLRGGHLRTFVTLERIDSNPRNGGIRGEGVPDATPDGVRGEDAPVVRRPNPLAKRPLADFDRDWDADDDYYAGVTVPITDAEIEGYDAAIRGDPVWGEGYRDDGDMVVRGADGKVDKMLTARARAARDEALLLDDLRRQIDELHIPPFGPSALRIPPFDPEAYKARQAELSAARSRLPHRAAEWLRWRPRRPSWWARHVTWPLLRLRARLFEREARDG